MPGLMPGLLVNEFAVREAQPGLFSQSTILKGGQPVEFHRLFRNLARNTAGAKQSNAISHTLPNPSNAA
jgi:hypothetical protein